MHGCCCSWGRADGLMDTSCIDYLPWAAHEHKPTQVGPGLTSKDTAQQAEQAGLGQAEAGMHLLSGMRQAAVILTSKAVTGWCGC